MRHKEVFKRHPHPPPPSDGGFPFIPVRPTPQPSHSRRPIDPKKSKVCRSPHIAPARTRHPDFSLPTSYRSPTAQNPDAPTRPRIEFHLDRRQGHPPRRPMTIVAWTGSMPPQKVQGLSRKKKLKLPSENFRRRTDRFFPNFFPKNLAGESSGRTSKVA